MNNKNKMELFKIFLLIDGAIFIVLALMWLAIYCLITWPIYVLIITPALIAGFVTYCGWRAEKKQREYQSSDDTEDKNNLQ